MLGSLRIPHRPFQSRVLVDCLLWAQSNLELAMGGAPRKLNCSPIPWTRGTPSVTAEQSEAMRRQLLGFREQLQACFGKPSSEDKMPGMSSNQAEYLTWTWLVPMKPRAAQPHRVQVELTGNLPLAGASPADALRIVVQVQRVVAR